MLTIIFPPDHLARADNGWDGKQVVQKDAKFSLQSENQVADPNKRIEVYRVERVDGDRFLLTAPGVRGWAPAATVIEFDQAFDHFNKAIRADPVDVHAYIMRAFVRQMHSTSLREAEARPTASSPATAALPRSTMELFEALDDYNSATRLDPQNATAHHYRGKAWIMIGEFEKAITDINQAIRLDPQYTAAYISRGYAWNRKKQYDNAIEDYTQAIRLYPQYAEAYIRRGESRCARGDLVNAIGDFSEAIRLLPQNAYLYFARGRAMAARSQYDKAIDDFNQAIRIDADFDEAYDQRGRAWQAKSEEEKRIAELPARTRSAAQSADAYMSRARNRLEREQYDAAISDFNQAIQLLRRDASGGVVLNLVTLAHAFTSRGSAWIAKKEYDKAVDDFTSAIRVNPESADAFIYRGGAWSAKDENDNAIADYTEAIRVQRPSPGRLFADSVAYAKRASAWSAKKVYSKAIDDLTEAARLDPKNMILHFDRAVVRLITGDGQALGDVGTVLDLQHWRGYQANHAVLIGYFAGQRAGKADQARALLKEATAKGDSSSWPYPVVRYLLGEIDQEALLTTADNDAKRTEAQCYLGLNCALTGRNEKALGHLGWVTEHSVAKTAEYFIYLLTVAEVDRLARGKASGRDGGRERSPFLLDP
jgi:tetratricopeptide (TPR) repeat protein